MFLLLLINDVTGKVPISASRIVPVLFVRRNVALRLDTHVAKGFEKPPLCVHGFIFEFFFRFHGPQLAIPLLMNDVKGGWRLVHLFIVGVSALHCEEYLCVPF